MYYINPEECIDCAACEPVCPVAAIFAEDAVPADQQEYIAINRDFPYPSLTAHAGRRKNSQPAIMSRLVLRRPASGC